jgi:hypothetical protein
MYQTNTKSRKNLLKEKIDGLFEKMFIRRLTDKILVLFPWGNFAEKQEFDMGKELIYQLSREIDEKGHQFVKSSSGKLEFGAIKTNCNLTPAPIILSEGVITNPETNHGYGLVHIEARHGNQIRQGGYHSVIEFIEEVANSFDVIREGKSRNGNNTYLLQLAKERYNYTLIVELSNNGTYWNVNTAGIFKTTYGAKRNVVYNRHTTAKQPAETVEVSLNEKQSSTTS